MPAMANVSNFDDSLNALLNMQPGEAQFNGARLVAQHVAVQVDQAYESLVDADFLLGQPLPLKHPVAIEPIYTNQISDPRSMVQLVDRCAAMTWAGPLAVSLLSHHFYLLALLHSAASHLETSLDGNLMKSLFEASQSAGIRVLQHEQHSIDALAWTKLAHGATTLFYVFRSRSTHSQASGNDDALLLGTLLQLLHTCANFLAYQQVTARDVLENTTYLPAAWLTPTHGFALELALKTRRLDWARRFVLDLPSVEHRPSLIDPQNSTLFTRLQLMKYYYYSAITIGSQACSPGEYGRAADACLFVLACPAKSKVSAVQIAAHRKWVLFTLSSLRPLQTSDATADFASAALAHSSLLVVRAVMSLNAPYLEFARALCATARMCTVNSLLSHTANATLSQKSELFTKLGDSVEALLPFARSHANAHLVHRVLCTAMSSLCIIRSLSSVYAKLPLTVTVAQSIGLTGVTALEWLIASLIDSGHLTADIVTSRDNSSSKYVHFSASTSRASGARLTLALETLANERTILENLIRSRELNGASMKALQNKPSAGGTGRGPRLGTGGGRGAVAEEDYDEMLESD